jgi:hypothetical protein
LAETVVTRELTGIFAIYNVAGALAGALGALASGLPSLLASRFGWNMIAAQRSGFVAYAAIALIAAIVYRSLSGAVEVDASPVHIAPLAKSRGIVVHLATLFSLDAFGGGFVIQSLRHSGFSVVSTCLSRPPGSSFLLPVSLDRYRNSYRSLSPPESDGSGRWSIRTCRPTPS